MHTTTHHPPASTGMADRPKPVAAIIQPTQKHLPPLAEYVDLQGLFPSVQHTFPTVDSIRWFARVHREYLAKTGAVIAITGRLRYHPDLFAKAAVEIGSEAVRGFN